MKHLCIWLLVIALCAGLLAGCDAGNAPLSPDPTGNGQTQPAEDVVELEDTYWIACQWCDEDGALYALPNDNWDLDLWIRADGTARFRDIHDGVFLVDDSNLELSWERTQEDELLFYSRLYTAPVLRGSWADGALQLDYRGTPLTMQQAPTPQTAGQLYVPAELTGTWLLISGETEGYVYDVMPNELTSLIFATSSFGEGLYLYADMEEREYDGTMRRTDYAQIVELLDEPLYDGCANELWSVRIGDPSPKDANGYPTEAELYATLVGENELLVQHYYTLDGAPAVSYQTYLRLPELVSWMNYQAIELDYSNWSCVGYEDAAGRELPLPAELEGFSVLLTLDEGCLIDYDGTQYTGSWLISEGGVLLLRSDENEDAPLWFGGVVSGFVCETETDSVTVYEMALYYQGGILRLHLDSYG